MRRAARTDANHAEIRDALRKAGVRVEDCSHVGNGFADLVGFFHGHTTLLECKDGNKPPSARKLTPDQERFHESARQGGVKIHVVENVEQALAVFGMRKAA